MLRSEPLIAFAIMHPLQIVFPQQAKYFLPVSSVGNSSVQIGQSSLAGGCLKRSLSDTTSAKRILSWGCSSGVNISSEILTPGSSYDVEAPTDRLQMM